MHGHEHGGFERQPAEPARGRRARAPLSAVRRPRTSASRRARASSSTARAPTPRARGGRARRRGAPLHRSHPARPSKRSSATWPMRSPTTPTTSTRRARSGLISRRAAGRGRAVRALPGARRWPEYPAPQRPPRRSDETIRRMLSAPGLRRDRRHPRGARSAGARRRRCGASRAAGGRVQRGHARAVGRRCKRFLFRNLYRPSAGDADHRPEAASRCANCSMPTSSARRRGCPTSCVERATATRAVADDRGHDRSLRG